MTTTNSPFKFPPFVSETPSIRHGGKKLNIEVDSTIWPLYVYVDKGGQTCYFTTPRTVRKSDVMYEGNQVHDVGAGGYSLSQSVPKDDGYYYFFVEFSSPFSEDVSSPIVSLWSPKVGRWTSFSLEQGKYLCVGFLVREIEIFDVTPREGQYVMGKIVERPVHVQSKSNPNKSYEVLVYTDGTMSCNCPAWKFKGGITHGCKHTKSVGRK